MNEPKWTPGPWEVSIEDEAIDIIGETSNGVPTIVTCLCESSCSPEEDIANARLIALAPELYELVEKLIPWAQAYAASQGVTLREAGFISDLIATARAALLKANPQQ